MSRYRAVPPHQVHVDGRTYGPGESFDADDEEAAAWLAAGWAEKVTEKKTGKRR